ncbi:TPA: DUF551 domain-containing protein [Escherichia coli]|jgi:hypothetical protein|uniref:DUF551 domain-containing protein n=2 Tax=Escherichia coli TaxID=562 RepID=UPI00101BB598|nr:DUF551 domain-containing protein [Escherichia coli]EIH2929684.1 DUF551 domain-containing protein [Escherichia coli]EJT5652849.1 DUF551 domain-containing protein [Escherichia coli]ELB5313298.1 DUF551 domain-containing protein [Escherichia coli]MBF7902443.1 DUF551 domain-containing protein [Escherichia coli]MBF7906373.1 DUF551 domain-containing protein [Escherichia coli]
MTTFTDKELIKEIKERIGSLDVRDNIERRAYEIALASLEAEPVAWMRDDADGREYNARNEFSGGGGGVPLYATPPAPVVPEEKPIPNPLSMYAVDAVAAIAEVRGWNACRAAMLHSAEPASNHEELPLDYLQGQKDGLEWAAQLAEANHPQTGDWLYDDPLELAKAIRKGPDMPEFDGPTPVNPDGWISCSERMPEETGDIIVVSDGIVMSGISYSRRDGFYIAALEYDDDEPIGGVTHWMLLPEPPQEVK